MLVLRPQFIKADIQSADLISHVLQTEEIDTIMHFAAQVQTHSCALFARPSDSNWNCIAACIPALNAMSALCLT